MISKPIILSHSCVLVTLIYGFTINYILCISSVPAYKQIEIIDDLPGKKDLDTYLLTLEKIVFFAHSHKRYVDLNLNFGLLLSNVNLKRTFEKRGHRLFTQTRVRLDTLLKMNDEIQNYFYKMVRENLDQFEKTDASLYRISHLLVNESSWLNHVQRFNIELLKKTKFYKKKELESVYSKWPEYVSNLDKIHHPTMNETDICLDLLSQNPVNENTNIVHCQVPYNCARLMLEGSHYGHGITNRILFLLLARFSRGCALLSPAEDRDLLEALCATAYNEAEFIAYHDFELPHIFIPIICLCSLDGHAQFMRRSWLDEAIDYQSTLGCFNLAKPNRAMERGIEHNGAYENFAWRITNTQGAIEDGACSVPVTAAATGMLSGAIRYILENYY